ncbi:MAG: radical SAM protein [Candidatus Margulisiibacteriota bacterium]
MLESCTVCPRNCRKNRLKNEEGYCRSGLKIKVSSIGPHYGEEPPISGTKGSGTVFFSNCNLRCRFCQNYQISQEGLGYFISEEELADKMLELQVQGCHNINLVSPTHFGPQILKTIIMAKGKGLAVPIVYNSNGYESLEMLKLFDGYIDIYLPDIKYSDNKMALKYSEVGDYVENNRTAIKEMFRQVGELKLDENGIAVKGMIVRHLVLPNNIAGSYESLKFLASIYPDIQISIMSQYSPCHKAIGDPDLGRKLTKEEYEKALKWADDFGFLNIFIQEMGSSENYLPDFNRRNPFE